MAGKGYSSVVAGKEFFFESFFDNLRDYYLDEPSADSIHDQVTQLIGMAQTFIDEIDTREFSQNHAYEALAYLALAGFFLKEFEKFRDSEYSERRTELADTWNQVMSRLQSKGLESIIPFPY